MKQEIEIAVRKKNSFIKITITKDDFIKLTNKLYKIFVSHKREVVDDPVGVVLHPIDYKTFKYGAALAPPFPDRSGFTTMAFMGIPIYCGINKTPIFLFNDGEFVEREFSKHIKK